MTLDILLEPVEHDSTPCKLQRVVLSLEEPYRSALTKLVDTTFVDGGLSDSGLYMRLQKAGLQASTPVIWRHRNKVCSCYRGE